TLADPTRRSSDLDELADAPALRQALEDLARDERLATVPLRPLSRDDTLRLVRALARSGDDAALGRLGEQAWAASEGNPFVAVETVRAHAEGGVVAHGRGLGLPERVREIVGRRLERPSERGHALALGLHYRSAEAWDRAVRYLRQAGIAAFQRAANREAAASLEAALEAVEKMTESPERSGYAIDIRVDLENALMGLGQFQRSLERLR